MNANGFAAHIDIAAFDGAHFAFAQHPQDALRSFFWIAEQCVRPRARNEPAVVQVIAISENFACELQTMRLAGAGELAVIRCKQN